MLAVVGLGNPGKEYARTRHNVGYRVVAALAGEETSFEKKPTYLFVGKRLAGRRVVLAKPTTYMNRSGAAVRALLADFGLEPSNLLVVSDDANLPLGRIRVRPGGSDGGQKGLASIIEAIGTESVPRLRLGIGAPADGAELADYVLEPFSREEAEAAGEMIERAVLCARAWVTGGVERAMERFNRKESAPARDADAESTG